MIKHRNLSPGLRASVEGALDISQLYWLVDSDYRTAAQGWSKSDGTGPLDLLYSGRADAGHLFRTGDYSSDYLAFKAAMDEMVDYRGDTLVITPGNVNISTAVSWNVPYGRIMGRVTGSPDKGCSPTVRNCTITLGVASALTLPSTADGLEIGYLRFIPLTAASGITVNGGPDYVYAHDFLWDTIGITANAATILFDVLTSVTTGWLVDQFTWISDAPQGPLMQQAIGSNYFQLSNFVHMHGDTGGDYVTSLLEIATGGAAADSILVGPGRGVVGVVGAGTVTSLVDSVALTGTGSNLITGFMGGLNYCTASTLSSDTSDFVLTENYFSTNGGVLYTS